MNILQRKNTMDKITNTINIINNIEQKANMTAEESLDLIRGYIQYLNELLAENELQMKTEGNDLKALQEERNSIATRKFVAKKRLEQLEKVDKKQDSKENDYSEIQTTINRLIEIKENQKNIVDNLAKKAALLIVSKDPEELKRSISFYSKGNKIVIDLIKEEVDEIYPKLTALFSKLTPEEKKKFAGIDQMIKSSTAEVVKEQYKAVARKYREFQEAIEENKDNEVLVNYYKKMLAELGDNISAIKFTLDDTELFEQIKIEADKELDREFSRRNKKEQKPVQKDEEVVLNPIKPDTIGAEEETTTKQNAPIQNNNSDDSSTTNSSQSDKSEEDIIKETPITPIMTTEEGTVNSSQTKQDEPKQEQAVSAPKTIVRPDVTEEVERYKQYIEMINKQIAEIRDLLAEEEVISATNDFSGNTMNKISQLENRISNLNDRVFELKIEMSNYEFEVFKDKKYMLGMDPEIKGMKIDAIEYNDSIEQYMEIHNDRIKKAYEKLQQLSDRYQIMTDENAKMQFKTASDSIFDYINSENEIINRRLIAEKKNNPSFDVVGFVYAHRIDFQKNLQQDQSPEVAPTVQQPEQPVKPEVDVVALKAEFKEKMTVLMGELTMNKIDISFIELEPLTKEQEEAKIEELKAKMTEISQKIKDLLASYDEITMEEKSQIYAEIKADNEKVENAAKEKNSQAVQERKRFKEAYRELEMLAKTCREKSPDGIEADGFNEVYNAILNKRNEIRDELGKEHIIQKINSKTKELYIAYVYEYNGEKVIIEAPILELHGKSKTVEVPETQQQYGYIEDIKLNLGENPEDAKKVEAIAKEFSKTKLHILKTGIRIQYTAGLKKQLEDAKYKIEEGITIQIKDEQGNVVGTLDATTEEPSRKL